MKLAYFPNQTALRSEPVWRAFLHGMQVAGITVSEDDMEADCAVIWSVLWHGRLIANQQVYDHYKNQGKPVFIIEVGALDRGRTWKVSVNNITSHGIYANTQDLDPNRGSKLGIELLPIQSNRKDSILIAGQHQNSLQWEHQPTLTQWIHDKISEIRKYTDRPIVVRPHPRCGIEQIFENSIITEIPVKLVDTYDKYDIDFGYHCVVNHNSGPGIQAGISGCPVIVDQTSLAFPISSKIEDIDSVVVPDRYDWFQKILHTEWTTEEMIQGIPQKRLLKALTL